jgi:hypothetical protein
MRTWAHCRAEEYLNGGLHLRDFVSVEEEEEGMKRVLLLRVGELRSWARTRLFEGWFARSVPLSSF